MTGTIECRYYGRDFTTEEMALLRALIAGPPPLNRHALSKEFCRRIGWLKPDGGLKDMMARVTMLAMHKDGLITLPPPRWQPGPPKPVVFGPDTEPPLFPAPTTLDEVRPLKMRTVGLDPRRNDPGARALRPGKAVRQAPQGHLAPAAAKRLEAGPQPLIPDPPRHYRTCVDAPFDASIFFGRLSACGQVLSCVRPLNAARHTPRALMEMRGPGPYRLRELESSASGSWFSRSRLD